MCNPIRIQSDSPESGCVEEGVSDTEVPGSLVPGSGGGGAVTVEPQKIDSLPSLNIIDIVQH
jgi:hypothetical protein